MNRRSLLILVAVSAVTVGGYLLARLCGTATPRLWLLGITNAPSGNGTLAVLCLENSAGHAIYVSGPTNGSTFFTREVAAQQGWQPAEVAAPPMADYTWGLNSGQKLVFSVPVVTNQQVAWRVTVRYGEGAVYGHIPVFYRILPGGGPSFRLPWAGSGKHYTISTVISKHQL